MNQRISIPLIVHINIDVETNHTDTNPVTLEKEMLKALNEPTLVERAKQESPTGPVIVRAKRPYNRLRKYHYDPKEDLALIDEGWGQSQVARKLNIPYWAVRRILARRAV